MHPENQRSNGMRPLLNEKTKHSLPTTKDYILREYADVFKGVGSLAGRPYHIRLKQSYKPVQHPPRSVSIGMQSAHKAELYRLIKEDIIMEVHTQSGSTLSCQW